MEILRLRNVIHFSLNTLLLYILSIIYPEKGGTLIVIPLFGMGPYRVRVKMCDIDICH